MQIDSAGFTAALGAANRLNEGVSPASAWGVEAILTCLLVFTVFAATDSQRAKDTAHLPVSLMSMIYKVYPFLWVLWLAVRESSL